MCYEHARSGADEIKLGWYQLESGERLELQYVLSGTDGTRLCCIMEDGSTRIPAMEWFQKHLTEYIGTTLPEPGEWVDPGEVKLSELPMRARFRRADNQDWKEGQLIGGTYQMDPLSFFCITDSGSKMWFEICQVWRPLK